MPCLYDTVSSKISLHACIPQHDAWPWSISSVGRFDSPLLVPGLVGKTERFPLFACGLVHVLLAKQVQAGAHKTYKRHADLRETSSLDPDPAVAASRTYSLQPVILGGVCSCVIILSGYMTTRRARTLKPAVFTTSLRIKRHSWYKNRQPHQPK